MAQKVADLTWRILLTLLLTLILLSACASPKGYGENSKGKKYSNYALPISQRTFYIGLVPTPKNSPSTTFEDITAAYEETGRIAEVVMIWVRKQGIGELEVLKKNRIIEGVRVYGLKPVITLNFATIKQAEGGLTYVVDAPEDVPAELTDATFRARWVKEAKELALMYKPEYFSLGNEINDYFYLHPEKLDAYLTLFDEAKAAIKEVSPTTKVFVVFSYNRIIENNQWDILKKFDSRADLIGLTTYPWKQYRKPEDIPMHYYSQLTRYVSKPIAFTEIGWASAPPSSEKQQSKFLLRFLELTKSLDIEMVNWLFLHEMKPGGIAGKISRTETATIALKKSDGTKKDIYFLWLDLKALPKK
jgi:hypothetical protein